MSEHRRALAAMLLVTLLWSMAGLVSRQFETAARFELTFWRSFFTAIGCALLLFALQGRAWLQGLRDPALWVSGVCWCVMFTAFMLALTITTVANVLITMSLSPVFTALLSRLWLKTPVAPRTIAAIALAATGIAVMYGGGVSALGGTHALGVAVTLCVPIAGAVNWCLLSRAAGSGHTVDLMPAVFSGAVLCCALTLYLALPFKATPRDIGWLAYLGVMQLALPCMLAVWCAKQLAPAEMALLSLLEIIFGIALVWVFAGEQPSLPVLIGGSLVIAALAGNELITIFTPSSKEIKIG